MIEEGTKCMGGGVESGCYNRHKGVTKKGKTVGSIKRILVEIISYGKGEQQGARSESGGDVQILACTVVHEGSFPA